MLSCKTFLFLRHISLVYLTLSLICSATGTRINSQSNERCGLRYKPFDKDESTDLKSDRPGATLYASEPATFPWLARVVLGEKTLCTGAFVTSNIVLTSAHCVLEHSRKSLGFHDSLGNSFKAENVIIHPDYNPIHPSGQHDLALIKLEEDHLVSPSFACLPEIGDDPIMDCQSAAFVRGSTIYAHKLNFAPSMSCMETPFLRGYIQSSQDILCSAEGPCLELYKGPTFCSVQGRYQLAGIPTNNTNWCQVGAMTRIARYRTWIKNTVEYLDPKGKQSREPFAKVDSKVEEEEEDKDEDEERPCSRNPCGTNAVCWNSGSRYMCTCDPDFPKGNAYFSCHECLYDQDCKGGSKTKQTDQRIKPFFKLVLWLVLERGSLYG